MSGLDRAPSRLGLTGTKQPPETYQHSKAKPPGYPPYSQEEVAAMEVVAAREYLKQQVLHLQHHVLKLRDSEAQGHSNSTANDQPRDSCGLLNSVPMLSVGEMMAQLARCLVDLDKGELIASPLQHAPQPGPVRRTAVSGAHHNGWSGASIPGHPPACAPHRPSPGLGSGSGPHLSSGPSTSKQLHSEPLLVRSSLPADSTGVADNPGCLEHGVKRQQQHDLESKGPLKRPNMCPGSADGPAGPSSPKPHAVSGSSWTGAGLHQGTATTPEPQALPHSPTSVADPPGPPRLTSLVQQQPLHASQQLQQLPTSIPSQAPPARRSAYGTLIGPHSTSGSSSNGHAHAAQADLQLARGAMSLGLPRSGHAFAPPTCYSAFPGHLLGETLLDAAPCWASAPGSARSNNNGGIRPQALGFIMGRGDGSMHTRATAGVGASWRSGLADNASLTTQPRRTSAPGYLPTLPAAKARAASTATELATGATAIRGLCPPTLVPLPHPHLPRATPPAAPHCNGAVASSTLCDASHGQRQSFEDMSVDAGHGTDEHGLLDLLLSEDLV